MTASPCGPFLAVYHRSGMFSTRSGMGLLAEAVGAESFVHEIAWQKLQGRSWMLSQAVRAMGVLYFGSRWNGLLPIWDAWRIRSTLRRKDARLVHILWGEFATPRLARWCVPKGIPLIGSFHASARRQESVFGRRRPFLVYDWITLMSETQKAYFVERGFPASRLSVVLHGVDTGFFRPAEPASGPSDGPLRGLIVGSTERDHIFLSEVMRNLPPGVMNLTVVTRSYDDLAAYRGCPGVVTKGWLDDHALLEKYRASDLLLMPLMDSTANNAILESMACGTPVMVNRVGGVPEYVSPECNIVVEGKVVDDWCRKLRDISADRGRLVRMRAETRAWAERFDWRIIAKQYKQVYIRQIER